MARPTTRTIARRPAVPEPELVAIGRGHRDIRRLTAQILAEERRAGASDAGARIAIGELLAQVRERLDPGEWLAWLAEEVPFTPRSAQRYLELAAWAQSQAALARKLAPLGASKLYILSRLPARDLDKLLRREQHRIPSSGRARTLALMTVGELIELVMALSGRPAASPEVGALLSAYRRRLTGLDQATEALLAHRAVLDPADVSVFHRRLLEAAAQLAKSFALGDR